MTYTHTKKYLGKMWLNPFMKWLSDQGYKLTETNESDEIFRMIKGGTLVCGMWRQAGKKFSVNRPALFLVEAFKKEMIYPHVTRKLHDQF